ncbi:hypothetical protein BCR32DRAFT_285201 [Anaeromyces robustus]|uniref:Uncharacterized protein n=1 Tax=Anaeromyces robustus TaxID=1754192 RepID=A0A1Y1WQL8_9FUNG|nr:hypothetical protein BCR32DRAFT_285201 [Anaeromyces robustus]|eukprot:ORX75414.1 hypothetical protein BCR32DRAFT_285201 [Anaeromyces robustus]
MIKVIVLLLLIEKSGKPCVQVEFKSETKDFTPDEISSMILSKMKDNAEAILTEATKEEYESSRKELQKVVNLITTKIYQQAEEFP